LAKSYLTALQVARLTTDPSVGLPGQIYFNTTTHKFRGYTTYWQDLGSGSGGGTGTGQIFVDYQGNSIVNNQYFVIGSKTNTPTSPLVGDIWIVTDDQSTIPPNLLYQGAGSAPDPTQYQLWADPSDFGGALFYTSSTAPSNPYVGEFWASNDITSNNAVTIATTAPDPTIYEFWADPTDTTNSVQYSQIYTTFANFPDPSTVPGRIVQEAQYGKVYYAYNGNWVGLSTISDANYLLDSVNQTANFAYNLSLKNLDNSALEWMSAGLV